ncbi:MAG: primosomal protein N' [Rubricoccaceae bacterium]
MVAAAQVVPLAPVEGVFSYRVPLEMDADAQPGARVLVPFGRRMLTGVIAARGGACPEEAREVVDVLDARPALTPELLALTRWIAEYYVCTWGEALRAALPSGTSLESRRVVRALAPPEAWPDAADGPARTLAEALREANGEGVPLRRIEDGLGRAFPAHRLRRLEAAGCIALDDEVGVARARARLEPHLSLVDGADARGVRGEKQRALLAVLARSATPLRQADALRVSGASAAAARALAARGLVRIDVRPVERRADGLDGPAPSPPEALALHPAQQAAVDALVAALDAAAEPEPAGAQSTGEQGPVRTFLLHGVTGSGKTEVYLRALRHALAAGRTALVLVPEIALTPQTVRRFRAHFGDRVAVLHSRMSPGERLDAWTAIREGRFPVVIGPRSAVLAPVERLGLVIVDEEHEASYKQFDPAPRYHARDVAVMRAHRAGAVCVLGSATPSLETVANVRAGKYAYLGMPERVPVAGRPAAPLPPVRLVDLTREREVRRLKGALSDTLRDAVAARLARGEQTILLQNRRGYAPVATCDSCGFTPSCRDCAVSLTVHKAARQLRCHYCGRAERLPETCPACGERAVRLLGAGTQRVEEELADVFPEARLLRMDLDTTARRGAHRTLLERFGRGEADILLGTQMVAKGLDFPRVTLVGVVNADTGMLLPDFRAAERTFQLLAQVAGRAGRHDLPGEVILQTRNPDHPALRFACAHDVAGFVRHELAERRALGYPPFGRMVGIECKGPEEDAVHALAGRCAEALGRAAAEIGAEVLGPAAAAVGRVQRQWRVHLFVKAPRCVPATALAAAVRTGTAVAVPAGCRINLDVDPVGLF